MFEPWQKALLDECRVARLATIAKDGRPRLVPVCYALALTPNPSPAAAGEGSQERLSIAVAVDEKPKRRTRLARLTDVARDARVTLLVDRYEEDWSRLAWVRVEGEAEVLERGDGWAEGLAALRERYRQYEAMRLEELPLMRIGVVRVTGWRATPR